MIRKHPTILVVIILHIASISWSQVSIGSDDGAASAMLDVQSSEKGVLIPRLDSLSREEIDNPASGLLVYDSTYASYWYYDGIEWLEIANSAKQLSFAQLNLEQDEFACFEPISTRKLGADITDMDTDGDLLAILELSDGDSLKIVDISSPSAPVQLSAIPCPGPAQKVLIQGDYLYLMANDPGQWFNIYDISTPASPTVVSSLSTTGGLAIRGLAVQGNYAFITDAAVDSVLLVDISDPLAPVRKTGLALNNPVDVMVADEKLYTTTITNDRLRIHDISNLPTFNLLSATNVGSNPAQGLLLMGSDLYIGVQSVLKKYDVSDPGNPVFRDQFSFSENIQSFDILDDYAFFSLEASANPNLLILDVSDGLTEIHSSNLDHEAGPLMIAGDHLFLSQSSTAESCLVYPALPYCERYIGIDKNTGEIIFRTATEFAQQLSITDDILDISGGNSVDLATLDQQQLSLDVDQLTLSKGNTVTLPDFDNQSLAMSGQDLSIDGGPVISLRDAIPAGYILMYYGSSAPSGWLVCNGDSFSAATYPELQAVLGSTVLPNLNGRFPLGVGSSGSPGAFNHPLGDTGGAETHTLSIGRMPSHSHAVGISFREGSEGGNGSNEYSDLGAPASTYNASRVLETDSTGDGQSHNNMPPFLTVLFIIKAH